MNDDEKAAVPSAITEVRRADGGVTHRAQVVGEHADAVRMRDAIVADLAGAPLDSAAPHGIVATAEGWIVEVHEAPPLSSRDPSIVGEGL